MTSRYGRRHLHLRNKFTLMHCAECVANTQKHFRNNHRHLSRMYLEKHEIEFTLPRFSSLYYKSSSSYPANTCWAHNYVVLLVLSCYGTSFIGLRFFLCICRSGHRHLVARKSDMRGGGGGGGSCVYCNPTDPL